MLKKQNGDQMIVRRMAGKVFCLFLALLFCLLLLGGCAEKKLEYKIAVSGQALTGGAVRFLDYSINVYDDPASNPCGDCADQPVHLYAGATAEETANAIAEQITRADDLWEVASLQGTEVVLREKTTGSVQEIPALSGPEGLSFAASASGRTVTMLSEGSAVQEAEVEQPAWPSDPQRLAAVYGPSYELLTMLGAEDKIVVRADVQTDDFPWAEKVFSRISGVPALLNVHTAVSFEQLMKYDPQIVYSFPRQDEVMQLEKAGIAVLPGETGQTLADLEEQVHVYAQTLGAAAEQRADEYCAYFDQKLSDIRSVTEKIPEEERKRVYYAGIDILTTYGKYSDLMEVIEAAGGIPVSKGLEAGNRTQIDYEQLMEWKPDAIFIDHGGINDGKTVEQLKEELMTTPTYAALEAVKNGQVYLSPSGVFYWDMGLQKILLVEYMAKCLYPERFADLDMEQEVMEFYEQFFRYSLTRQEAGKILNRQLP